MNTVELRRLLTDRFVSERTGIVTRLTDIHNDLSGIDIYGTIAHLSTPNYLSYETDREAVGFSFDSRAEAELKSIMEAIERHSSAIVYEEDVVPYDGVDGRCEHFLDRFDSDVDPASLRYRQFVTTDGSEVYLPAQFAYFPYYGLGEPPIIENTTNGLAAHTSENRAKLNGALELIERESILRFWLNRIALPKLDPEGTELGRVQTALAEQNLRLELYRAKIVEEVETVFAIITATDESQPLLSFGASAGVSVKDVATEAVVECLHMRLWQRHYYDGKPAKPDRIDGMFGRAQYWSSEPDDRKIAFVRENSTRTRLATAQNPSTADGDAIETALVTGDLDLPEMYFTDVTVPYVANEGIHIWRAFCPEFHPFYLSGDGKKYVSPNHKSIIDGESRSGTNEAVPHPML